MYLFMVFTSHFFSLFNFLSDEFFMPNLGHRICCCGKFFFVIKTFDDFYVVYIIKNVDLFCRDPHQQRQQHAVEENVIIA